LRPVEQKVVVIEYVLLLLGLDIGREQFLELRCPAGAPGYDVPMACSIGIAALTQRE
jgi:hypothetical protein